MKKTAAIALTLSLCAILMTGCRRNGASTTPSTTQPSTNATTIMPTTKATTVPTTSATTHPTAPSGTSNTTGTTGNGVVGDIVDDITGKNGGMGRNRG